MRTWSPPDTTKWLTFLAHHLNTIGSRDLAWWQLHRAAPRATAIAAALLRRFTWGLRSAFIGGCGGDPQMESSPEPFRPGVGLVVGFARGLTVGRVLGLASGLDLLSAGLNVGLIARTWTRADIRGRGRHPPRARGSVGGAGWSVHSRGPACLCGLPAPGANSTTSTELLGMAEGRLVLRFVPGFAVGLMLGGVLALGGAGAYGRVSGLLFGLLSEPHHGWQSGSPRGRRRPSPTAPRTPIAAFRGDLRLVQVRCSPAGARSVRPSELRTYWSVGSGSQRNSDRSPRHRRDRTRDGLHRPSGRYLVLCPPSIFATRSLYAS